MKWDEAPMSLVKRMERKPASLCDRLFAVVHDQDILRSDSENAQAKLEPPLAEN